MIDKLATNIDKSLHQWTLKINQADRLEEGIASYLLLMND